MVGKSRFLDEKACVAYCLKHGVSVDESGRHLTATGAGLKVLGAIDFLVNTHKYIATLKERRGSGESRRQDHVKELQSSSSLGS